MSLGFGFGLPHHVAILGGGGPPPATVYFLSLTTSTSSGSISSVPAPIVDGSGNILVFGYDTFLGGEVIKLTSSGAFSTSKYFSPSGSALAAPNGSGGYYVLIDTSLGCCCCGYYPYPSILNLDSSFNILSETRTNSSGQTSVASIPLIDSSGNILAVVYDQTNGYSGGGILFKINSALNSANYLSYNAGNAILRTVKDAAITTTNQLVYTGSYLVAGVCCIYSAYATVTSVSAATPTATPTWQVWDSSGTVGDFDALALDSSNNVYVGMFYYNTVNNNTLVKISSAGAVQWQYRYVNMTHISDIATDSSGNVYCVAVSITGALVIIKVNSSGVLQYSRTLTPPTGVINGYQRIAISGSIMYITASWANKLLVFKVPTDGSLTQSISVGGFSFTYAAGSVTSAATTIALASTTTPPALASTGVPLTTTPIAAYVTTATTAVTTL